MELLAGELSPDEATSLRAAIDACGECGADFEMMALLMDCSGPALMATAPAEMDEPILAAARAHAEKQRAAAPSLWSRLGSWLEGFAVGPQFAMATVMVLVVAVGFWYVPKHQSHDVAGTTVVLSDPEGEAVAADDPAVLALEAPGTEPSEFEAGETRGDETPADELPGAVARRDGQPEAAFPNNGETGPTEASEHAPREDVSLQAEGAARVAEVSPMWRRERSGAGTSMNNRDEAAQEPRRTVTTRTSMAMTRGATRMVIGGGGFNSDDGADDIENVQSQSAVWAQELEGVAMPSYNDEGLARTPSPQAQAESPPGQEVPRQQAPSRNPPAGAAAGSSAGEMNSVPAPSPTSPSRALLQLARNHRSRARCDEAVRHYESLIRRFAGSPEVPAALMESADCYRRLGRLSDAERNLRRARQFASTRANADRELRRIATLRSAQRRAMPAPEAPRQNTSSAH